MEQFKDSLNHANQWLLSMEKAAPAGDQVNWLSLQETRSRLLKLKTDLADANSHKRVIEAVNEKGAALGQAGILEPDIGFQIEKVNERYNNVLEGMKRAIGTMEDSIDYIQQYQELQRSHQDWQKQVSYKCGDEFFTDH